MEETQTNYCLPRTDAVKRILTAARVKPNPFKISSENDGEGKDAYLIDIDDASKLRESGYIIVKTGNTSTEHVFFASLSKYARTIRRTKKAKCSAGGKKMYADFFMQNLTEERDIVKERVDKAQENISEHRKQLVLNLRALEKGRIGLANIEKSLSDGRSKFEREFESILAMPKVTDVRISDSKIEVHTDTLYVVDPRSGTEHVLGKFRIVIDEPFENPGVMIFNKSRHVEGMQAPHVFEGGDPCWGNIEETINELLAKLDLNLLVQIILSYLQNVNVDDQAGSQVDEWPESNRSERARAAAQPVVLDEATRDRLRNEYAEKHQPRPRRHVRNARR